MNDLILTVDTGGSKTELTLFDAAGNELVCQKCSGLGTAHTALLPVDALGESVLPLLGDRAPSCVGCVVINVGGSNTAQLEQAFASLFPHARVSAYRESSGIIMSALCDAEQADALLMAGTGSIAISKGPRRSMITDGWCPNVGDLGSGYWIGLEAIRRSVLSLENGQPLSPLAKEVTGFEHPFGAFESTGQQMELRDRVRARFMPL
jgi:N-acetylglucosamine kinase-like BadF-type ATPase